MTIPSQSVQIRRIMYASGTQPIEPYLYDDQYDSLPDTDVLDPVLAYNPLWTISGYKWDGTRQVVAPPSTYHLNFDGVDDKVVIPASASLNNLPLGDFTVEFSSLLNAEAGNIGYLIAKADGNSGDDGLTIYGDISPSSETMYFALNSGGAVVNYTEFVPPNDGISHVFTFCYNKVANLVKIFIDGILQTPTFSSTPENPYLGDGSYDMTFMIDTTSLADYTFKGEMNWARILNVLLHTSNFTPPSLTTCPPADANTVLRLALDEGAGTTANDTSGNHNDGTITGAPWEAD